MTTSTQNLLTIAEVLHAAGKEVKIRRLPTAHGTKANRYADRIRGGSSRVRTGAGSRSVHQSTKATAMGDVLWPQWSGFVIRSAPRRGVAPPWRVWLKR